MGYFMQCVDTAKGYPLMGTDNQFIINDLKTLRGVLNRIHKYNINHSKDFEIYKFYGHFLDNNMRLVYRSY
jgi:hypothetical protein